MLALSSHRVEWVLAGSVAVLAWHGPPWPFRPADLDVVPERSPANLERVARLLESLDARPVFLPDWPEGLTPEQCAAWTPWPAEVARLDHLLETRLGRLDIVPERAGRFESLEPRSHPLEAWGIGLRVADPEDLLSTMRLHKPKHAARVPVMDAIVARRRGNLPPAGLE